MFKFLKLRNSDSGDARRHVPFRSIIHKQIITLILVFIFVLFTSVVPVSAVDVPLPPVWLPMNPYNSDALHNNYVLLNDDQKKIANEIMGAYGSVFLGLAANPLQNPIDTILKARSWLQEYGSTLFNAIFDSSVQSPRAMQDLVGSVTYKASTYESYSDYENDTSPNINSGSEKYFQFNPELTVAYKNWFAVHGNIYEWQKHIVDLSTLNPFNWKVGVHQTLQSLYNGYLSQSIGNTCRISFINSDYNIDNAQAYSKNGLFSTYHNLFLDSSSGTAYLVDDNGIKINGTYYLVCFIDIGGWRVANWESSSMNNIAISISSFSTLNSAVEYIFSNNGSKQLLNLNNFSSNGSACLSDFITNIYYGSSWATKQPWTMIEDLNIGASPSAYIDNIGDDAFVNINGLIGYLGSDVTDVREGVFENTLVREGDHAVKLTDSILKAIDRAVEATKSGIVIPTDVFSSLFDDGKGFISYMWYMTKPLVIYTRDLLDLLTFDPINGFNASGPGYFILGVIGLGVIGGVIVKFLL